jgi:hypothetical protein
MSGDFYCHNGVLDKVHAFIKLQKDKTKLERFLLFANTYNDIKDVKPTMWSQKEISVKNRYREWDISSIEMTPGSVARVEYYEKNLGARPIILIGAVSFTISLCIHSPDNPLVLLDCPAVLKKLLGIRSTPGVRDLEVLLGVERDCSDYCIEKTNIGARLLQLYLYEQRKAET